MDDKRYFKQHFSYWHKTGYQIRKESSHVCLLEVSMFSLFLPHHDIAEILLKCVLNTINQSINQSIYLFQSVDSKVFLQCAISCVSFYHRSEFDWGNTILQIKTTVLLQVNSKQFIGGILYYRLKLPSCCKSTVNSLLVEYYTSD